MLQPRNVIAIPNINEAREHPELSVGQDVLALYPSTTCFYKARIVEPPSKVNNSIRSLNKKKRLTYLRIKTLQEIIRYNLKMITTNFNM